MLRHLLGLSLRPFGVRRERGGRSAHEQHLIVSMLDEGCSYAVIRRRLKVPNAAIDVAIRHRGDGI
ncbi:hypothetical protein [Aureimonas jatrophae]|uniref:Homeodomain-like domain-containing protein n=1 Tax=Aureimonas jatrophae TaxID=1166073 RepID=A0A1H0FJI8_9HYPH|nr:hypothetical protein [Aureimonas jatrophae]MBB3949988.1 hypothetical protein [Aureimonas jatrophae]SDN94817.1 hypothetical protein SAMN05192530_102547 [Aureimonas jatrophae]